MNTPENHNDKEANMSREAKSAEIRQELNEIAPSLSRLKEQLPAPEQFSKELSTAQAADLKGLKAKILQQTALQTAEHTQPEAAPVEMPSRNRGVFRLPVFARVAAAAAILIGAFLVFSPMINSDKGDGSIGTVTYDNEFDRLFASLSDEELQAIVSEQADNFSLDYIEATFGADEQEVDWNMLDEVEEGEIFDLIDPADFSDNEIELFL